MPLHIQVPSVVPDIVEPEALVQYLVDSKIDVTDEDSLREAAPALHGLYRNRRFLVADMASSIQRMYDIQTKNSYSPQVHMIWSAVEQGTPFSIRACFWPSEEDDILKATGADPFFYYRAHDHNFNFLTVGYFGSGYGSDYYEYDHEQHHGYPGEKVDLNFVERASLEEGKILLYRAFRDIHSQLPPENFSVSINILEANIRSAVTDQYFFDIDNGCIIGEANSFSPQPLLSAYAVLAGKDDKELLFDLAKTHRSERFRLAAWSALLQSANSQDEAAGILARVPCNSGRRITEWSVREKASVGD